MIITPFALGALIAALTHREERRGGLGAAPPPTSKTWTRLVGTVQKATRLSEAASRAGDCAKAWRLLRIAKAAIDRLRTAKDVDPMDEGTVDQMEFRYRIAHMLYEMRCRPRNP